MKKAGLTKQAEINFCPSDKFPLASSLTKLLTVSENEALVLLQLNLKPKGLTIIGSKCINPSAL
jgi:hypothetical protein